ncbi:MAG: histidinol-phosphate transaminase [Clostridia bacterium]|nr:histidinol-phosphate transaminase [Clostridia bacterium]
MSRYFSEKYASLIPYVPGEQPRDRQYIKLNANENPFPPSPKAQSEAAKELSRLMLYSDARNTVLHRELASFYGLEEDEVLATNGSDEILDLAMMAFCDEKHPALFPDITYGFYKIAADVYGVPYEEIPLDGDLRIRPEDYFASGKTIFLANPNAPSGIALPLRDVEAVIASNPETVVVVDEAYVDFGGESALSLIPRYDNLLVTRTFSKSRSMAGARLGFGAGNRELIRDLNAVKFSSNPYNVNLMTAAAGIGALRDEAYTQKNLALIRENRAYLTEGLRALGFQLTDSQTNFVFARRPGVSGEALYLALKEKGILVRHFSSPRIRDYLRITVGAREELDALLGAIKTILEEMK